jgi:hypothetical protein
MRKDVSKWSFDVFTGQIKIEGRNTATHIAGAAAGQVPGVVINRELMTYLFMHMSFINCISDTESNGRAIRNYEGRDILRYLAGYN